MQAEPPDPPIATDLEPHDNNGPPRAPIISVCASKGGAGKSTLASNIAAWMAHPTPQRPDGLGVLVIDAEPQGHLGDNLGALPATATKVDQGDLADAFAAAELDHGTGATEHLGHHFDTHPLAPTAHANVSLLRGGLELVNARAQVMSGGEDGERWLRTIALFFAPHFDLVIIDSPPVLASPLGIGAIYAADLIVTPVMADDWQAIKALDQFAEVVIPMGDDVAPLIPVAMAAREKRTLWSAVPRLADGDEVGGIDHLVQTEGREGYLQEATELVASVTNERERRGPWLSVVPYDMQVSTQSAAAHPIVTSRRSGSPAGTALRAAAERAFQIARSQVGVSA